MVSDFVERFCTLRKQSVTQLEIIYLWPLPTVPVLSAGCQLSHLGSCPAQAGVPLCSSPTHLEGLAGLLGSLALGAKLPLALAATSYAANLVETLSMGQPAVRSEHRRMLPCALLATFD